MAAEEGDAVTFIFTGAQGEVIPRNATRFIAHESVTVIPARLFYNHPNIVELICHIGVIRIEEFAFDGCPRLRRVIIPGVKVVEHYTFYKCRAVTYVECPMLDRIGIDAFAECKSLSNINLPSAKVVERAAFCGCIALTEAKFGGDLESFGELAFYKSPSLERVTIPLKTGLITADNIFTGCESLKNVDLVDETVLHEAAAALLLEGWRNDMNEEIESINQILPNAPAGDYGDVGGKARAMREWIERVSHKIIHFKAQHHHLLNEVASSLMHALPNDIVMNNILPFLHLPSHTFDGEDDDEEEDSSSSSDDTEESYDTSDGSDDDEGDDDDEELHDASVGSDRQQEEEYNDETRKRRKTTNDDKSGGA